MTSRGRMLWRDGMLVAVMEAEEREMTSEEDWERAWRLDTLIAASKAKVRGVRVLPDRAYDALVRRVQGGEEIYAYKAAGANGPWNLWIRDRRVPIAEWLKEWEDAQDAS